MRRNLPTVKSFKPYSQQDPPIVDVRIGLKPSRQTDKFIYNIIGDCWGISNVGMTIDNYPLVKKKIDPALTKLRKLGVTIESEQSGGWINILIETTSADDAEKLLYNEVLRYCFGVSSWSLRILDYPTVSRRIEETLEKLRIDSEVIVDFNPDDAQDQEFQSLTKTINTVMKSKIISLLASLMIASTRRRTVRLETTISFTPRKNTIQKALQNLK